MFYPFLSHVFFSPSLPCSQFFALALALDLCLSGCLANFSLQVMLSCSCATFSTFTFALFLSVRVCVCALLIWVPWTLSAFLTLEMVNVSTFARKVHVIYMHVRTVRKSQILCLFLHFPNDSSNTHAPHLFSIAFLRLPLLNVLLSHHSSCCGKQYFLTFSSSMPWIFLASV